MRYLRVAHVCLALAVAAGGVAADAQEKKPVAEKHGSQALVDSLGEVINAGADLFNKHGDYAGCYRLYQGGLMAVKPFLTADLQKKIEQGIARAEGMRRFSDRAFELREVIDEIRSRSRGTEPKKENKKVAATIDPNAGQVQGRVSSRGQPAPPGFTTLVGGDKRRFSASIAADGTFTFKTPIPPGEYRIAIERVPGAQIPPNLDIDARYRSEETSGIKLSVSKGKNYFEMNLVK